MKKTMLKKQKIALYAITKHGIGIAKRLMQASMDCHFFVPEKYHHWCADHQPLTLPLPIAPFLGKNFHAYECHLFIVSAGAVVRLIAPFLKNKKIDPAVVCVDDDARFAICLLSGHIGYGNIYTQKIANALNAQAVITTASDARDTLKIDILGREYGWHIHDAHNYMTKACASVVNEMPVAIVQEAGEEDFWDPTKPLPKNIVYMRSLTSLQENIYTTLLLITDKIVDDHALKGYQTIIYRPLSLVLGVGCDKGISIEMLERGILSILKKHKIAIESIRMLATIDIKKNEPAIRALAAQWNWSMTTYPAEILDAVTGIASPSMVVKHHTGTRGVAEPACLKAANTQTLVLTKTIYKEESENKSMTMALARISFPTFEHKTQ